MLAGGWDRRKGNVATQVTMEDGTESPLVDHIRDAHQKGTRGYTEEYLDTMHRALHKRKREPEEELEHRHPDAAGEGDRASSQYQRGPGEMDSRDRGPALPGTPEAVNNKHRDRDEQEMPAAMKSKNRKGQDMNGKHRDRYEQHAPEVPGQRNGQPQGQAMREDTNGRQDMPDDLNGMNGTNGDRDEQMAMAGGHQRNGKHRKQRH
jgi:hypothetical protein